MDEPFAVLADKMTLAGHADCIMIRAGLAGTRGIRTNSSVLL